MCLQRKRKNHFYELNTMKHNWEYKKLKEVCQKGSSNIQQNKIAEITGNYPVYGASGFVQNVDFYHQEKPYIGIVKDGSGVGRVNIYPAQTSLLGTMQYILPNDKVLLGYLAYCLQSLELSKFASGAAIPHIYFRDYGESFIPLPPLPIQQKIVAELDKVSLIIDKKRQQLKELDNLAQAIFYDMFGDPVENEKGWEVKTMGEIGTLQRGSGLSKKDLVENGHPCILYGQIHTRFGAFTKTHIACIPDYLVNTAKIAHTGDLIMAITSEDVEGSCKSTAWLGNYDIAIGSDAAIFRHNQNGIYISYYTKTKAFYNEKAKFARGFKVTHISTKEIATIPIMIPPLSLQQSFAAKIEAIEKQKELISRSIKEAQTLFDERMDYWFD